MRAVQETRNIVSDADKIAGRWNKEDKVGEVIYHNYV